MDAGYLFCAVLASLVCHVCAGPIFNIPDDYYYPYKTDVDWFKMGQKTLNDRMNLKPNMGVAKNIILFIGDGMGLPSVTAARIYYGQKNGQSGDDYQLSFDSFPYIGQIKTYAVDSQGPDSAATITALLSGVKTNYRLLGVNQKVVVEDPSTVKGNEVESIAVWSHNEGKSVGVVTDTRLTHATPAGMYAITAAREWEYDDEVPADKKDIKEAEDIASQFISKAGYFKVALAGGRSYFMTKDQTDPEYNDKKGKREDGQDLIKIWLDDKANKSLTAEYVWNTAAFNDVDAATTDHLLGLFEPSHMKFEIDRKDDSAGEPSLEEMTQKAIEILSKNKEKGFFLLVEGGNIDQAHHKGLAKAAFENLIVFDKAIEKAKSMTDEKDTLILVTADHGHAFSISGYPKRGTPILQFDTTYNRVPDDYLPVPIITYASGPGGNDGRYNLSGIDLEADKFVFPALMPMGSSGHGGEDVVIWARGPMAHLFDGVNEQNYVAHVMAYASCVGANKKHCDKKPEGDKKPEPCSAGITSLVDRFVVLLIAVLMPLLFK